MRTPPRILLVSMLAYGILAGVLSYAQADYVGADFVAYVTVAKRIIEHAPHAINGYWSPLFSWLMVPLLASGIDDLIAGRIVLLLSGIVYLAAIDRLTRTLLNHTTLAGGWIRVGVMTCATIQAAQWATYLLDPDLLANALLFSYFCVVSADFSTRRSSQVFLCGIVAGMTYLAKAYMLPFCVLHFILTAIGYRVFERFRSTNTEPLFAWIRPVAVFGLAMALIAGPWIGCLTQKYGKPTFSTAGSANHANMSPENFRKDPLWNPGLTPDFISEPFLGPDWSPFQDFQHFQHQLSIVGYNLSNCIGLVPGWLALCALAITIVLMKRVQLPGEILWVALWLVCTSVVYCSGYMLVNLEARYITPTSAPLLCIASLILLFAAQQQVSSTPQFQWAWISQGRVLSPLTAFLLIVAFSAVDIFGLVKIARSHPQSMKRSTIRPVVDRLIDENIPLVRTASNNWHFGLYVAYLGNRLEEYWGTPTAQEFNDDVNGLEQKDIKVFLRFVVATNDASASRPQNPFDRHASWSKQSEAKTSGKAPLMCEVYTTDLR